MKEKISQINNSIEIKSSQLKKQADEDFVAISDYSSTLNSTESQKKTKSINPIVSKVLYTSSAVLASSAIGVKFYDWLKQHKFDDSLPQEESNKLSSKLSLFAAISAAGGFVWSKMNYLNPTLSPSPTPIDVVSLKNDVISKGIASVKRITSDWEEFMEKNQTQMFAIIDSSPLSEREKDELTSKIYSYEVIDINLSELMAKVNAVSSPVDIAESLDVFKSMFISSIEKAAAKQRSRYNSLNI